MANAAINLYTLRTLDEPLVETLERVATAGYDGVEFAGGVSADTADGIAAVLDRTELVAAAAHVGVDDLDADLPAVVDACATVDCDTVVVPYIEADGFSSVANAERTAARLDTLADRLADDGISLHYHNHAHEFVDLEDDDRTGFDVFVESSDVGIELDVGWVAAAGHDPVAVLERLGDRCELVHLKDMDVETAMPVEIGHGDVDLVGCTEVARENGAAWLIYEHDHPEDPATSVDTGASYLADL